MIHDHYGSQNIIIERATEAADGSGGTTKTWSTHLTLDGLIQPLSSQELLILERIGNKSTHKLYTDVEDILVTDRVVENGVTYNITGSPINPGNRDHHLETKLELLE